MDKLFRTSKTSRESGEHWLTISDLMAGLMMVFLFIAIVFMLHAQQENDKIKNVAVAYQQNQVAIYDALQHEFKEDLDKWGATIDKETLSFSFQAPDVLFANNEATLTRAYKAILDDFFPRYVQVLRPYRDSLNEVRIEGHTSSSRGKGATEAQAYFYNMMLSQGRTRAVLEYTYTLMPDEADWIKATIAAVGFSSSRLIMKDGVEDEAQSRRVSFRAITNADIQIKRILESQ